jgi:predicted lipid carrier protein YhbT
MPSFSDFLLQPFVDILLGFLIRNHPGVIDRLKAEGAPSFLIEPVDLPLAFFFQTATPKITVGDSSGILVGVGRQDATIRGPLLALIDMLEGRVDGDSLFFTRTLEIEGSMEAVLLLRNAVDDAEINLTGEILTALGPLAPAARIAFSKTGELHRNLVNKLDLIHRSAIAPLALKIESQARQMGQFEERLSTVEKGLRRRNTPV